MFKFPFVASIDNFHVGSCLSAIIAHQNIMHDKTSSDLFDKWLRNKLYGYLT